MTSTKAFKANAKPRAKSRMRCEIVEAMHGLHKVGAASDGEREKTTLRITGAPGAILTQGCLVLNGGAAVGG